jgi:hypothetical protein
LAAALGLSGEIDEVREVLAKSIKIRLEFNPLARLRRAIPWTEDPRYINLAENRFEAGLRKAGMSGE